MKQINSRDTINITNPFNLLSEEALRMVVPYHHLPKKNYGIPQTCIELSCTELLTRADYLLEQDGLS